MSEQITELPRNSAAIKELATELVHYLKGNIRNTKSPVDWTWQNFSLLDRFFGDRGCYQNFTGSGEGPEFLWDFTAYIPYQGMLLVAESEHDTKYEEIAKDFDRLLYSNAPLKLMMCRIERDRNTHEANEEALRIQERLLENVRQNCTNYSGGDVIIVYCVWWALPDGKNRDFAYLLQIEGEPEHRGAKGKSFAPVEASEVVGV
jgi:hypothetical protein